LLLLLLLFGFGVEIFWKKRLHGFFAKSSLWAIRAKRAGLGFKRTIDEKTHRYSDTTDLFKIIRAASQ